MFQGATQAQITGAGQALKFDGVNDQVTVTGFGNSAPTNEITIEFWQKVTIAKAQYTITMNFASSVNKLSIMTPWSDGSVYWDYANSGSGRLSHAATLTGFTNVWNHLAFVASQSGNYMGIFRNGVQVASKSGMTPRTLGNFDLLIGSSSGFAFGGNIDELRIWKTARSTNEILTNMHRRLSGTESNLVLYFQADEGSGTTTADATTNGFTGNLLSGATFVASGAPIGPPVVTTQPATAVTNTTATANANVNPVGQAAGVYFEYGLTTNYTATTSVTNLAAGTNAVAVSMSLTGLVAGTTYQLRAVSTNAGGIAYGTNQTFATTAPPPSGPTVVTLAATGISATGATLNGTVNANGLLSGAYFQYGLTTNYGSTAAVVGTFNGTSTAAAANSIAGLTPGQTYHFRLVATNSGGTGYGSNLTFNTLAAAPTANTLAASAVTATTATLNSTISGNGAATTAYFEWGLTTGYGATTSPQAVAAGAINTAVNAAISELQPGTTYHFRSVATNSVGTTLGVNQQFTTPPLPPVAVSVAASGVSGQAATLNGTVTANGASTTVAFQWGTTTGYGNTTSPQVFAGSTVAGPFSQPLSGLQPVTTYHFRAVATNSAGTSLGGDQVFHTPPIAPAVTTTAASGVTSSNATLNGTVTANGAATGVYFQWGVTTNYGSITSAQNFATNAVGAAASRPLAGLAPGTTYYFRAVATNSAGTNFGTGLSFLTLPDPPSPVTLAASAVAKTSATLNGTVTANGNATTAYFQWGTTVGYGSVTSGQSFPANATAAPFNAPLAGLSPGVSYHFRAVASNSAGTVFGADQAFTTLPDAPAVTTTAATGVTSSNATLNGTVTANGAATGVYFQWGVTTNYGSVTSAQNFATNAVGAAVSRPLAGLAPGTTYYFRAVATNSAGTNFGTGLSFLTLPDPPAPVTLAADTVTKTSATLNGTVTANGNATTAYFQWGTTVGYGSVTSGQNFPSNATAAAFNAPLAGLSPGVSYHFRAVASNSAGTVFGADQAFTTLPDAPAVTTTAASGVTSSNATLNGTVTANGAATGVYFEWGTTTNYGTLTSAQNFATNAAGAAASRALSGLVPSTTYHFRAVATNSVGTNFGGDQSFTTPAQSPFVTTVAATTVVTNGAALNGVVTANGAATTVYFQWGTTVSYGSSTAPQNFSAGASNAVFNASLSGLAPGTTYHFRAVASNSVGTVFGLDQAFNTPPMSPTATTLAASGITGGSAALNGLVNPGGGPTAVYFQYGLTAGYGSVTTATNLSGVSAVAVSQNLSGLGGATTYHFRLVASNAASVVFGSDESFTTLVPGPGSAVSFDGVDDQVYLTNFCATAPTNEITIEFWQKVSAAAIQATFTINTDNNNNLINAHIPYVDGVVYWDFGDFQGGGRLSYSPPESIVGTWQHFALVSSETENYMRIYRNGVLEAQKAGRTPFVRTNIDLVIGGVGLPFNGVIDEFRIWSVARTASQIETNFSRRLVGNEANLIAYYRFDEGAGLVAGDSSGQGSSAALVNGTTWVTSDAPIGVASATTLPASNVVATSATLNGSANPRGIQTIAFFQWGPTTNYGNSVLVTNIGNGNASVALAGPLTGLTPGTDYHFRMVASNGVGAVFGADQTFTTILPGPLTAVSFDGVNDQVLITNFCATAPTNEITIEFWQRVNAAAVQATFTINTDNFNNLINAHIPFVDGVVYWDFGDYQGGGRLSYTPPESIVGSWQHFALVSSQSSNHMRIYRNGVLEAEKVGMTPFVRTNLDLIIGGIGVIPFNGAIDEFRIWNVARTTGEIQGHMNRRLTGSESNLVLYYRFDEGAGPSVSDSSGNGYTGGLVNGATWIGSTAPIYASPSVTTLAAGSVTSSGGTLNGNISANGTASAAWFEWGTTAAYGSATSPQNFSANAADAPFNAPLAGLTPGVLYHYRAVATNAAGTNFGAALTFTTLHVAPSVTTVAASSVTSTSGTLDGTVTANGTATGAWFEWGTTAGYGSSTSPQNFAANASGISFNAPLAGLTPGVLYHYRAVATNAAGTNFGADLTFTTLLVAPSVTTVAASSVTNTSGTLNGTVTANGTATGAWFEWGTTAGYGSSTSPQNFAANASGVSFNAPLAGLTPGVLYHYRAVATNAAGTNFGADLTFTTTLSPAEVVTIAASPVTHNGATLRGTVNPNGASTLAYFQYGPTTSYGTTVNVTNLLNGVGVVAVSNSIAGLTPGAGYHFRLVATNSSGLVLGEDQSFTVPSLPFFTGQVTLGDGSFKLLFTGITGLGYTVLGSTNLTNWTELGPASSLGGNAFEFTDVNATNSTMRFYQFRSP